MKKISTLFLKDPNDLSRVTRYIDPNNSWVIDGEGIPTRKFDGTSTAIIDGELYKRYDLKPNKKNHLYSGIWRVEDFKNVPDGAIPCQDPDIITGHWPHWVKCNRKNKEDKYHFEAFDKLKAYYSQEVFTDKDDRNHIDGTYELCGEKIKNNPEGVVGHILIKHGSVILDIEDFSYEGLKQYLSDPTVDIEGIVFHHKTDGRMCKIRKIDFGVKR